MLWWHFSCLSWCICKCQSPPQVHMKEENTEVCWTVGLNIEEGQRYIFRYKTYPHVSGLLTDVLCKLKHSFYRCTQTANVSNPQTQTPKKLLDDKLMTAPVFSSSNELPYYLPSVPLFFQHQFTDFYFCSVLAYAENLYACVLTDMFLSAYPTCLFVI